MERSQPVNLSKRKREDRGMDGGRKYFKLLFLPLDNIQPKLKSIRYIIRCNF